MICPFCRKEFDDKESLRRHLDEGASKREEALNYDASGCFY